MTDNEIAKLIRESIPGESCKQMANLDKLIVDELELLQKLLGVKDENKMNYLTAQLQSDIPKYYGELTSKEIKNVFSLGVKGLLGEWRWFDLQTTTMWFKNYKSKRGTIIYQDNKKETTQKQIDPPKNHPDKYWHDELEKYIQQHKTLPVWNYTPVFLHLEAIGEISMNTEEKKRYLKKVTEQIRHDNYYNETMKQVVNDSNPKVVARNLLVQDYFRKKYNLAEQHST